MIFMPAISNESDGATACIPPIFVILVSNKGTPPFLTQFRDIFRAIQMTLDTVMNDTRAKILICIFLMVATFCIYSQVQDHEFINFDDDIYITDNLNVQAGLTSESVEWAFTTFTLGNWCPVTWFSHMLDYQLYGLHAKGHHLTSLFFHIANSLLLFLVLFRMTGAIWQSGFVAAMFAFHPLNVESVAWEAERKNVLWPGWIYSRTGLLLFDIL